ncbi:uncharacterized protein [Palaemon carinicauda]|uniref:uncharacterized protein n=1 Tax=Palaemon carinicauda TaxID=392227 RepID=UPI0035B66EAD
MGKCSWDGFIGSVKLVITFAFSHVGLCAVVTGYSIAGAFIFRELEQRNVVEHYDPLAKRNSCLSDIYNITERTGDLLDTNHWRSILNSTIWQDEVTELLERFERELKDAVESQLYDQGPDDQRERWNIIGSLFYCFTVITTIGYGHVSPQTLEGKMVTILYAIFGIPLMLLCLSNIGDSMATSFRFMYRRVCCACCKNNEEEDSENISKNLQTPSNSNGTAEPIPYTPSPHYKPNRRNMLISPPISATIHRGSDNPLRPTMEDMTKPASRSTSPRVPRPSYAHMSLQDLEANRVIAECAAYTKTTVPGLLVTSADSSVNECHDYDFLMPSLRPSPSDTTHHTPVPSAASSPLGRDAPDVWSVRKENGGPHITIDALIEQAPSNHSTRPGSPTLTFSAHHASNHSLAGSSSGSRVWPRQESNSSVGGLLSVSSEDDEPHRKHYNKQRPQRSLGKTLVVYNTLSGDALLEQSKIARKMALMNKGGFAPKRQEVTTVFTDPISGQAVDGDMLGLNYRPIPPDTSDADNRVPIPIVFAFLLSYLGIGALLFYWLEGWTLSDACYFCFITLSTIGFGDFVPAKSLGFETQEAKVKLVTGSLYLLFGLAVLAMSFNLVQEEVVLKCKSFAHWIGLLKD